jgi:hypothetical protein
MGDSGEGLVDADARAQERMEELRQERERRTGRVIRDPELFRALESMKMARADLVRQLNTTKHARRKTQLDQAIEEVDRRIAEISGRMSVEQSET